MPGDRPIKQQDQAAYWSSLWDYSSRACGQMAAKILITLKLEGVRDFFVFFRFQGVTANHNNFVSTEAIVLIFFSPVNKMDFVVDLRE